MTATLHQPGSRFARPLPRRERPLFASMPARNPSDAVLQPALFDTPSNAAASEIHPGVPLAIPELWSFDQDELNDNPVLNELCPIPLIGGMLLARQLITRAQLDECLLLQSQTYPDLPIGQILIQSGYISQAALDHTLGIQATIRSSLDEAAHT